VGGIICVSLFWIFSADHGEILPEDKPISRLQKMRSGGAATVNPIVRFTGPFKPIGLNVRMPTISSGTILAHSDCQKIHCITKAFATAEKEKGYRHEQQR
jgi:hypothetical protein